MTNANIVLAACAAAAFTLAGCSQATRADDPPANRWGGPPTAMMGGWGYGPGPMMGWGRMQGPGMGAWNGALPADMTAEQREQILAIERDLRAKQWPLMAQMHELKWALDEQGQRRDYDTMAALQKQMFENMLDARKRIEAVLGRQRSS